MIYNATYLLSDCRTWQSLASYQSKKDAVSDMEFHSQGRPYLVYPDNQNTSSIAPVVQSLIVNLQSTKTQLTSIPANSYTADLLSEVKSAIASFKDVLCFEEQL